MYSGQVEAGVKLQGWKDLNPSTTPNGAATNQGVYQYVLFGKYDNKSILWRILSADQKGTTRKGYLYSEKALESKKFDTSGPTNNYGSSSIRKFLVGTTASDFYKSDNFTEVEKSAVVVQTFITRDGTGDPPVGTTTDNAMFLPSSADLTEAKYGFLNGNGQDVNRKATDTSNNSVYYWTRSPVADGALDAWRVYDDGYLDNSNVYFTGVAVRPACFLNLESLIFKSGLKDFDLGSPPAGVAGSPENPYVLVLPGEVPTSAPSGWTTAFVSADRAPLHATRNGATITLEWGHNLTPAVKQWPNPADFVLSTGERPILITSDAGDKKRLTLTFAKTITGSNLTLSYNLNTDAIVIAKSGNVASVVNSFSNIAVTRGALTQHLADASVL